MEPPSTTRTSKRRGSRETDGKISGLMDPSARLQFVYKFEQKIAHIITCDHEAAVFEFFGSLRCERDLIRSSVGCYGCWFISHLHSLPNANVRSTVC